MRRAVFRENPLLTSDRSITARHVNEIRSDDRCNRLTSRVSVVVLMVCQRVDRVETDPMVAFDTEALLVLSRSVPALPS